MIALSVEIIWERDLRENRSRSAILVTDSDHLITTCLRSIDAESNNPMIEIVGCLAAILVARHDGRLLRAS